MSESFGGNVLTLKICFYGSVDLREAISASPSMATEALMLPPMTATATTALATATEASSATAMAVMRVNVFKICLYASVDLREVHAAVFDGQ